jgi:uncharacterized protein (TIGR03435 family)
MRGGLTLSIVLAGVALAQAPTSDKKPEFEVAAIKPAVDDGNHSSNSNKGQFTTHNLTLKWLIANAYDIDTSLILGGPAWLDSDSFDITAKFPEEFAQRTPETFLLMIQNLLADRFQLVIHREPRQVSGYWLSVAKGGPKMQAEKPDTKGSSTSANGMHLTAKNVTMERFAKGLSANRDIGKLVADKTGLSGGFNFELNWAPEQLGSKTESAPDDHPSIFTALQEQLGLKLESAKVPVQAIVVDRAEKPEGN